MMALMLRGRPIYTFGGLYVSARCRPELFPAGSTVVNPRIVKCSLTTKFYPGIFGVLRHSPSFAAPALKSARIPAFCIASGDWSRQTIKLQDHPTWQYVEHSLAYSRTHDQAYIDAVWRFGREAWRHNGIPLGRHRRIDEFEKVSTNDWTFDHARSYVQRIAGLAGLIQSSNSVPAYSHLSRTSGRVDADIGIAIDRNGEILHFRKGHHRLMIAHQLNVPTIRVSVELVHTNWLCAVMNMRRGTLAAELKSKSAETKTAVKEVISSHLMNWQVQASTTIQETSVAD